MSVPRVYDRLPMKLCYRRCCNGVVSQRLADFPEKYVSRTAEDGRYSVWEKNNYFSPDSTEREYIKMILPPPNITGVLHLGHALTVTIQDALARWYRMNGHCVVWIPGTDHAGIATQEIVERCLLKTKNVSKWDIGRENFLSFAWKWKDEKESIVKSQLRAMGASLDWSKEYFTMSKAHNAAVIEAFVLLHEKNLLYKAKDLVNWSPNLSSAISDIEVEHVYVSEETRLDVPGYTKKVTFGQAAELIYKVKNTKDEIVVTTTRPETVFGDVAIAVHPEDERYAKYVGQQVWHSIRNMYIPVIADECVDRSFGTGAMKITPAHDKLDYEVAKKHGLEIIDIIDDRGNITEAGNEYKGLPRFIARTKILDELKERQLLKDVKSHPMCIPVCSRSKDIIEYLLRDQWFVNCKDMARRAAEAVENGSLKILPNYHEETWYKFLNNIRDWCVSRQLWWGHRIPVYTAMIDGITKNIVARSEEEARSIAVQKYGYTGELSQDNDVLDTWFSSGILPFAAAGWPNEEFKQHYPLTLMETGHDILFFWVARMVMLSLELTDSLPFKEVILHGILCDAYGKKMSKTVGNVVLPENVINGISAEDFKKQTQESHSMGVLHSNELKRTLAANKKMYPDGIPECGADALRLTLCSQNIKSPTICFDAARCQTNKFFLNKIWQACKYTLRVTNESFYVTPEKPTIIDRWILSRLSSLVKTANEAFISRDFHKIISAIQDFAHYEFCDYYLEGTKWGFKDDNANIAESHKYVLVTCLETLLRIISPIAPYFADDLYLRLSNKLQNFKKVSSLLQTSYPLPEEFDSFRDAELDERMNQVIQLIEEIRVAFAGVSRRLDPRVHIITTDSNTADLYKDTVNLIKGGSKIWDICINSNVCVSGESTVQHSISDHCSLIIEVNDVTGMEKVLQNIKKRTSKSTKENETPKKQKGGVQM